MLLVNDKSTGERCPRHQRSLLWILVSRGEEGRVGERTHQVMNEDGWMDGWMLLLLQGRKHFRGRPSPIRPDDSLIKQ